MNTYYKLIFLISVVAFSVFAGEHPGGDIPVAVIMKAINEVNFKKGSAKWGNAKVGQQLATNDEVKTGDKSLALIKFTDNSLIRVRENSNVKIYAEKNKDQLSKNTYIDKGKVGFDVSKQEEEEFRFTTPTMVASIRGTGGYFKVDGEETLLFCSEGSIDVKATLGVRDSGTVLSGTYASVSNSGTINLGQGTEQMKTENQNLKKINAKKFVIKTTIGEVTIEYLDE